MQGINIVRRPLTETEIDLLMEDIKLYPDLIYVKKSRFQKYKDAFILEEAGSFVGICAVYETGRWVKLGPLVFLRKHHGKGYGKLLLTKIVSEYSNVNMFISSTNIAVQKIISRLGFKEIAGYLYLPYKMIYFLIGHLYEHIHWKLITEFIRKLILMKRNSRKFYIKTV
ncbi:MAG: GNAT family N-acetyltransferase [Microgenomates group bacterium]